jgi:hypothetical protein
MKNVNLYMVLGHQDPDVNVSSGGSYVATPDCETAVLGLSPAISPVYSGLPFLRWVAIWAGTSL